MANPDCTLSSPSYGSITVPVTAIDFGMRVIATEDIGRDNRIFYPRQAQQDTFTITVICVTTAQRDQFNHWIWGYASLASSPQSKTSIPLRVTCPARDFDFKGIPVSGWSYRGAPVALDTITWPITIQFDGAGPTVGQVWANQSSYYTGPTALTVGTPLYYPSQFYGPGNPGGGPPSGVPYDSPKGITPPAQPFTGKNVRGNVGNWGSPAAKVPKPGKIVAGAGSLGGGKVRRGKSVEPGSLFASSIAAGTTKK